MFPSIKNTAIRIASILWFMITEIPESNSVMVVLVDKFLHFLIGLVLW